MEGRGTEHARIEEGTWEWYMVRDEVWAAAGMDTGAIPLGGRGFLCMGCLETRLGRRLLPGDFIDAPVNWPSAIDTPRMWLVKSLRTPL